MKILTRTKKETNHDPVLEDSGVHPQRLEKLELIILTGCVILSILVHGMCRGISVSQEASGSR